eukprot:6145071-Amphidinium_carterae.1
MEPLDRNACEQIAHLWCFFTCFNDVYALLEHRRAARTPSADSVLRHRTGTSRSSPSPVTPSCEAAAF